MQSYSAEKTVKTSAPQIDLSPEKGASEEEIAIRVERILALATLEEKVAMMSGHGFFRIFEEDDKRWGSRPYRAGAGCERLGVPALLFTDGPRGVARGHSTCFPVSMARGASWDRDLEQRIGEVIAIEARAQGCNFTGAVCVNLLRHPAWGRAQETYGEDTYHVGEMGAALARGLQTHNLIATVKHFALNSIENARFKVDVRASERALREVYLPQFKKVLDAGCATVMSAYNKVNGEYCGQNRQLLTDILRNDWGFDGFVHSDWVKGVYNAYGAVAGLDIENPEPIHFGDKLTAAVQRRDISLSVVDTACRRILTVLYRFASAQDPLETYDARQVACHDHVALAREAAEKSAVLIRNEGILPLRKGERIGVFGRLANMVNTGDEGSSRVYPPHVVTPLQGICAFTGQDLQVAGDENDIEAAGLAAAQVETAIVLVGYTADEEGEFIPGDISLGHTMADGTAIERAPRPSRGGDRSDLGLPVDQGLLIRAVAASNPRTVVVLIAGSAVLCADWIGSVGALMQTFYSGMEGGAALARLLFGEISPSGKLPFSIAEAAEDYPFFDKDADTIEYDLFHGYTHLERHALGALFPIGHGLSYTHFSYRALRIRLSGDEIEVSISIRNDGQRQADEIAFLFVGFPGKEVERQKRLLKGFERVTLAPGQTRTILFRVPVSDLPYWCEKRREWRVERGQHIVQVADSGHPTAGLKQIIEL